MEAKSIEEISSDVMSALQQVNKKLASFRAHGQEIDSQIDRLFEADMDEDMRRRQQFYWLEKQKEIGKSSVYLSFVANQLNAAMMNLEKAGHHVAAYKNVKENR